MKVDFSDGFARRFLQFDEDMRNAIIDFAVHVGRYGLKGLPGRNKSSAVPNPHTKKQHKDHAFAQKHCLWHYHIGIPTYVGEHGDMTSEYVLHYQRFDEVIIIVDITTHPPFTLPNVGN